jgi:seryl-tRNA synthetase
VTATGGTVRSAERAYARPAARLEGLARLGLSWRRSGQASLRGPLLELADACDRAFLRLAAVFDAEQERHPASLPAADLQRVNYLASFPHQAAFAVRMDPAHLDEFLARPALEANGEVALGPLTPVTDVLTPAACYHLYAAHEGESFDRTRYLTTRNTCFRHEARYEPLRRMWSFTMREIVCLGTRTDTAGFVERARATVGDFLGLIDVPVDWLAATDPFFRPQTNPKYLMQRVQPSKQEATYGGDLAIGSVNVHHDHFGAAFALTRNGAPVHSACVAFGIERWLFAITDRHGFDPASWPPLEAAAEKARVRS